MSADAAIDVIREADIEPVAAFLTRQAQEHGLVPTPSNLSPAQRLRWLLLENPSRHPEVPFGWCIRAGASDAGATGGGRIAGVMICVPLRLSAGDFACTAVMICKFFIERAYRRAGMGSQMLAHYLKLGERFPLLATSANAASGALFAKAGGYVIAGTDHTMLGIGRFAPLLEEWVHRRTRRATVARVASWPMHIVPGRLRRLAWRAGTRGTLHPLRSAEEAAALRLRASPDLLAVTRDLPHLRWRYFSGESEQDVFCYRTGDRDADGTDRDRLVVVNQVSSGYRGQIRVLNVLDLWPPLDAGAAVGLAGALASRYAGTFDALWLRSQLPSAEEALRSAGFARHHFPAPLGWCMDPHGLLPTRNWYLVPGDSE